MSDQADAGDEGDQGDQDDLLVRVEGGVLQITLNRPAVGNSITPDQRNRLIELFESAGTDLEVRVIVLRAAPGKYFCTGADLRAPRPPAPERPEGAPDTVVGELSQMLQQGAQRLIAAVLDCPKPIVAAVNGTAAGLGANLALACDLIVAADSAKFVQIFVRRGITPDAGTAYLLPRLIGVAKAKQLVFLGDDLPAEEAERLGLVSWCVPDDEFDKAVEDWVGRLSRGPTKAIALSKWLLNRSLQSDRHGAFEDEAWAQEMASRTHDFQEGVAAFVERRDVEFRGW